MWEEVGVILPNEPHPRIHPGDATVVSAEGARVGLVTCSRCGATLLLDPRDLDRGLDVVEMHEAWHEEYP